MARANVLLKERRHVGLKFDAAAGEFRLVVTPGYKGESSGFKYLREAILNPAYIDVRLSETATDKESGKTWDVQKRFGGGTTHLGEGGGSEVTISPKGHVYDHEANPIQTIFAHEVLGHARLHQQGDAEAGKEESPIRIENELRKEQGLPSKEDARILPTINVIRERQVDKRKEEPK
jgi:hypothetical protein